MRQEIKEMSMMLPLLSGINFNGIFIKVWILLSFFMYNAARAQLNLVTNSASGYRIVVAADASGTEEKAALVLQHYLEEISSVSIPVITDNGKPGSDEICIGRTNRTAVKEKFKADGFIVKTVDKRLFIYGNQDRSTLFGVYHFLERYLGCRKFTSALKYVPKLSTIKLSSIRDLQNPQMSFRQVYYPDQYDEEYRDWHKLHLLEDEWGLWGHTFDKLVPASRYFKDHPEYYALVNGERKPVQLCLSNKDVYEILSNALAQQIEEHPEKKIWSVSQNDGLGFCTCGACTKTDNKYGGPQGSIVNFVNKVARRFPDRIIATLAYLYSKHPPKNLKPLNNVTILLSSIDVNRAKPIETDPRTVSFRNDVKGWSVLTNRLMVWDYVVQFTNYVSPFPNLNTLQANMKYFGMAKMSGAFIQGSENTPGEFSELKSYILAKLSWDPYADVANDAREFMTAYYGQAAPYIKQYSDELELGLLKSNRILDIYGDPAMEWNTWLRPEQIERYSNILEQAAIAVESESEFLIRVQKETLPLEFAVLQQARAYGIQKHGMFELKDGIWDVKPGIEKKIKHFAEVARNAGIMQMQEDGLTLGAYVKEWDHILKKGPLIHSAINCKVHVITPYSREYPAKGEGTLTDAGYGYNNFQYNYLGWYGDDMEVVIDLGESKLLSAVSAGFLEDQRHWAFLPVSVIIELSDDNQIFTKGGILTTACPEENYIKETHRLTADLAENSRARYVRIRAVNLKSLPDWRNFPNRKSWIFCDEIAVFEK
jgi:hypothetical protein